MPETIETLRWVEGGRIGRLHLIDQTRLPGELIEIECSSVESVWQAIRRLAVRGAPAIGIAAAYGVCLALEPHVDETEESFFDALDRAVQYLATSRPTAVNLFWALDRMSARARGARGQHGVAAIAQLLVAEAIAIHNEDRDMCHAIGRHGAALIEHGQAVLTHCNAGGLATAEYGTALSILFTAQDQGKTVQVFVDETRPLLQGARLTAWELQRRGIAATLICDSMAAQVMKEGRISAVVTGADRIAANGDAANKIGTYGLAILAHAHGIPFYVAAPSSTFDRSLASGDQIPIEQRSPEEVTHGFGPATAPDGIDVYNPAFDVTPARLIHTIVTERGLIHPVNAKTVGLAISD